VVSPRDTPVHHHRQGRRDKVSVISGISVSPRRRRLGLYYQLYFDNIGQEEVLRFLRELLRHLGRPVIVLLDIILPPIRGIPCDNFCDVIPDCTSSTFLPMLRS